MIKSLDESKRHSMQKKLDMLGVTQLVVTIISTTEDTLVFDRCIELGISLLDGMCAQVSAKNFIIFFLSNLEEMFAGSRKFL